MRALLISLALVIGVPAYAVTCEQLVEMAQASRTFSTLNRGSASTVTSTTAGLPFVYRLVFLKNELETYYLHVSTRSFLGGETATVNRIIGSAGNLEDLCRQGSWNVTRLGTDRYMLDGDMNLAGTTSHLNASVNLALPMIHNPEKVEIRVLGQLLGTVATVAAPAVDIKKLDLRAIPLCDGLPLPGRNNSQHCSADQDLSHLKE